MNDPLISNRMATHLVATITLWGLILSSLLGQGHPRIYTSAGEKDSFLERMHARPAVDDFVKQLRAHVDPYVIRHQKDSTWMVSRLQMYWTTRYSEVWVDGMDYAYGSGQAPVPTVRFSGSRDWATVYQKPALEDLTPYLDDPRGLYLQNTAKEGNPWEWTAASETGHIIEKINYEILHLASEAAFLYWTFGERRYADFARDVFVCYMTGMHHRHPPRTVAPHRNQDLMGLQTFEVIHESVVRPLTLCYDFLHAYLKQEGEDLEMMQAVFKKWAEQEIKYGVPDNNWNLMQAGYITYLALALEGDDAYADGRGRQYYLDQVLHHNSRKQKSLRDVMKNFDSKTGIWPEVAGYSIMVSDDIVEVFSMMDKTRNDHLLQQYPILEKAILANFNYLNPSGFTVAYGDAKYGHLRYGALELMISQYRKYGDQEKESLVTGLLKYFIEKGHYQRDEIGSLFDLFFHVDQLGDYPPRSIDDVVHPTFYSENVSWIVQRNGAADGEGMMISQNASLGNHSHANGINVEIFAKGMAVVPDCAAGKSYWSPDHREYYSRFPAHNTVIVDGQSDYRTMNSTVAYSLQSMYPAPDSAHLWGEITYANVDFIEPSTDARQQRLTSTIRTGPTSGYFIDVFRSARKDGNDKKHEYVLHSQGAPVRLMTFGGHPIDTEPTTQLGSQWGDLKGYDYLQEKYEAAWPNNVKAQFAMSDRSQQPLVMNAWMRGSPQRTLFTALAPPSRAMHRMSVPEELYGKPLPTLLVRQDGEAETRPFATVIEVLDKGDAGGIKSIHYFDTDDRDPRFVGMEITTGEGRIDYIYNHQDPQTLCVGNMGRFQGAYAVVTTRDDTVRSLFLGSGRELVQQEYGIKTAEESGSVWVSWDDTTITIQAQVDFSLKLPKGIASNVSTELLQSPFASKELNGWIKIRKGTHKCDTKEKNK